MASSVQVEIVRQPPERVYAYAVRPVLRDGASFADEGYAHTLRGARRVAKRKARALYRKRKRGDTHPPGHIETVEYP